MSDRISQFTTRIMGVCATAAISAFALVSMPAPANAVSLEEVKAHGTINIGIVTDQPPFSYIDGQGAHKGYDIDLTKIIADGLGVDINYVQVTTANRISQLQTQRIDLLAMPFGVFPERAEVVRYVSPLAQNFEIIYGPKDVELTDISGLAGKSIAVERGSSMDTKVTDEAPEGTNIMRYDDASSAVQSLLSGQVDFLGTFSHQFLGVEAAAPGRFDAKVEFGKSYLGYVVAQSSEDLGAAIAEIIKAKLVDGTLNALYNEHFKTDFPYPEIPKELNGVTFAISEQ